MQDASVADERINWPERIALGPAGGRAAPAAPAARDERRLVDRRPADAAAVRAAVHRLHALRPHGQPAAAARRALLRRPGRARAAARRGRRCTRATALHFRDARRRAGAARGHRRPRASRLRCRPRASPATCACSRRPATTPSRPSRWSSWLDGKTVLPENAVLLTFDAARADVVLNAAPVLKDVEMRATVFPIGGAYEKNPVWFSSPEQLRELERRFGWSIGAFAAREPRRDRGRGRRCSPYLSALEPGEDLDAVPRPRPRRVRRRAAGRRRHRHPRRRSRTRGPTARGAATGAPTTPASARSTSRRRARCSASASRSTRRSRSAC